MTGTCSWCGSELAEHTEAQHSACRAALAAELDAVFSGVDHA